MGGAEDRRNSPGHCLDLVLTEKDFSLIYVALYILTGTQSFKCLCTYSLMKSRGGTMRPTPVVLGPAHIDE